MSTKTPYRPIGDQIVKPRLWGPPAAYIDAGSARWSGKDHHIRDAVPGTGVTLQVSPCFFFFPSRPALPNRCPASRRARRRASRWPQDQNLIFAWLTSLYDVTHHMSTNKNTFSALIQHVHWTVSDARVFHCKWRKSDVR